MSVGSLITSASIEVSSTLYPVKLYQIYGQSLSDSSETFMLKVDMTQLYPVGEAVMIAILRDLKLAMLRTLWALIMPKAVVSLKPGEIKKINDKLIVEKTSDGKIVLYEVIEQ